MESGKDLSYWPGFVDALSNVVLTLVFVLVVFVFALVMASNKVGQKVLELAQLAHDREQQRALSEAEMLDLRQELREALTHLQESRSENDKLRRQVTELKRQQVPGAEEMNALKDKVNIQVEGTVSRKDAEDADVDRGSGAIIITFPRGIFELNDKTRGQLDQALMPQRQRLAGMVVKVRSVMGVETFSEAKRLAYYRGLTIRNYLIDKGFGNGKSIQVHIEQEKDVGDGRVEIRFHSR